MKIKVLSSTDIMNELKQKRDEKRFLLLSAEGSTRNSREYIVFESICESENGESSVFIVSFNEKDVTNLNSAGVRKVFDLIRNRLSSRKIDGYIVLVDKEKVGNKGEQNKEIIEKDDEDYIIKDLGILCKKLLENLLYCEQDRTYIAILGKKLCVEDEYFLYKINNFDKILQRVDYCNEIHDIRRIRKNENISEDVKNQMIQYLG